MRVVGIGEMCCHGFYVLFRKEPGAFAPLEALTDRFCVYFRHELPRLAEDSLARACADVMQ